MEDNPMKRIVLILLIASIEAAAQSPKIFRAKETVTATKVDETRAYFMARIDSLYKKLKAAKIPAPADDSACQVAKRTLVAFLTEPGSDTYLPGFNFSWLLAAGQNDMDGVTAQDMRKQFFREMAGNQSAEIDPE
jgi:hypothetical protein